jgi:hypothetical protein
MSIDEPHSITELNGSIIDRWSGVEMALGGGNEVLDECANRDGVLRTTPLVWRHPSIPFIQFTHLDLSLNDGRIVRIIAEAKGVSDSYGLRLEHLQSQNSPASAPDHPIYRNRELTELPTGAVRVEVVRESSSLAAIDVCLNISGVAVRLVAGEVYERDGRFEIVEADESILMQLNGQRPNWAFNSDATCCARSAG